MARRLPNKTGKTRNGLSEYRKKMPGEAEMDGIWEQGDQRPIIYCSRFPDAKNFMVRKVVASLG